MTEWLAIEAIVKQRDKEIMAANLAKLSSESTQSSDIPLTGPKDTPNASRDNDVFTDSDDDDASDMEVEAAERADQIADEAIDTKSTTAKMRRQRQVESQGSQTLMMVTNATFDADSQAQAGGDSGAEGGKTSPPHVENCGSKLAVEKSPCASPASSSGGVYSVS